MLVMVLVMLVAVVLVFGIISIVQSIFFVGVLAEEALYKCMSKRGSHWQLRWFQ